jgi:hypothetical protein
MMGGMVVVTPALRAIAGDAVETSAAITAIQRFQRRVPKKAQLGSDDFAHEMR